MESDCDDDGYMRGEQAYEEWMAIHSFVAANEGWGIFANTSSQANPLIVGLDEVGPDISPTIEDAWRWVLYGVKPHHVAARAVLEHNCPAELKRMRRLLPE
ncbi:hypothetical protein [Pseudomonas aeruginosa]|uniref:hypothetical protein n=1 Tax=Pseudomonas aeruginosa TaxID=287 RepID=UPI001ADB0F53|nr:hypothetical protein [Pseudomonas aeruginosa]MBO8337084.1 hypothetical protein [Pseudomonas aeruginosa]HCF4080871.1 hypothetical protein [Pseudomonas aeruginosa]